MGLIPEQDFNQMWAAFLEPVRALEERVTAMSRQSARAEVAGAVEVVAALPTAGQAGRIVMLDSDKTLYVDDGTAWNTLGGGSVGLAVSTIDGGMVFSTTSTSFVDVSSNWKVTLTPASTRVLVMAGVALKPTSNGYWRINQVSGTAGNQVTIGGTTNFHSTYAQAWSVTPGTAYTWQVQVRTAAGGTVYVHDWTGPYNSWIMALEVP